MKLSVFLVLTLVVFASAAAAAPLCTNLSMADYVALGSGGCQIGDKLFFDFFYQPSSSETALAVPASAVFLSPVATDTSNPGIVFSSSSWFVPGGSTVANSFIDASIGFSVTVLKGGQLIEDATLTLGDTRISGTGAATIGESIFSGDGNSELGVLNVNGSGLMVDHTFFAPTSSLQVKKNFFIGVPKCGSVDGCFASGSVGVSSFTENFSEIPEPVGSILIGSGLLALGAWRRRVNRG